MISRDVEWHTKNEDTVIEYARAMVEATVSTPGTVCGQRIYQSIIVRSSCSFRKGEEVHVDVIEVSVRSFKITELCSVVIVYS